MGLTVAGTINTQNLNPTTGTATAGSFLKLADRNSETYRSEIDRVSIQITGAYTGALTPQVSNNNETWVSVGPVAVENVGTGAFTQTIPSGATGAFLVDTAGFKYFRLSANAPFTGAANATAHGTVAEGGKVQYVKILDATADGEGKASVGTAGLKVDLGAQIAGEDLVNDVQKIEQRFRYGVETSSADQLQQTGATFLHSVVYSCTVASQIIIRDGTTTAGTAVKTLDLPVGCGSITFNCELAAGLYVDHVTGTATVNTIHR